ncbi:MAG TPA: Rad52/Rad22 family DNA repair protein [Gemmataceae bacterium]|nr:Rad52/Rad22 family DNA repair protein [Gemmataceae bacterium]
MHAAISPQSAPVEELTEALSAPFDPREVKFKPAVVSGNRALALAYVDARAIQDRLDDVLGVAGWQDEYECLPDGSVVCRLRLRLGNEWITKMDVGGPSEQPDEGDRRKAAFSDSLKRAAVKFGIGRYLYRLPSQWVDYDPRKKQFAKTPTLPPSALRHPSVQAAKNGVERVESEKQRMESGKRKADMPANGVELQRRVHDYDARLAQQGVCQAGELVKHIVQAGIKAGYEADLATWSGAAIVLAVEEARAFEARLRQQKVA